MKNRKKIMTWLLVAVALWAVWYFFLRKKQAPPPDTTNKGATNTGVVLDPAIFSPPNPPTREAFSYSGKRLIVPGYN